MAEYKCISCGKVEEAMGKICCPDCGFNMYEMPYLRKDKLVSENTRFISSLRLKSVELIMLKYSRHDPNDKLVYSKAVDDEARFPFLRDIQKYSAKCEKTSEYCEHVQKAIDQIKMHIHKEYEHTYKVGFDNLSERIDRFDKVLCKACSVIGIEWQPEEISWPSTRVKYRETPNNEVVTGDDILLDCADKLLVKYKRFIKTNNIYNSLHREKYTDDYKKLKNESYIDFCKRSSFSANEILDKHYMIDFMEDGSQESAEILNALWSCINTVMKSSFHNESYEFTVPDQSPIFDKEIEKYLLDYVSYRYKSIDEAIDHGLFSEKSEDELFDIYKEFLAIDDLKILRFGDIPTLSTGEGERKLQKLIGLEPVKSSVQKIKAYAIANKGSSDLNIHMCFYGNPGTGKTEVARIVAQILYENKILKSNNVVEVDRSGLISQYVGETPIKTRARITEAMGGVLFIDEAYSLVPKDGAAFDYGHEAIATLIKAMEDHRGEFCVILAGYKNEMKNMIATNPGFKSRIQFELDFPNYSRDELGEITKLMLSSRKYEADDTIINKILDITEIERKDPHFSNARCIRNILDQVIMCQNIRCMGENKQIGLADVNKYIDDNKIILPTSGEGWDKKLLSGDEELENLIGLEAVKRTVKKIRAYAKKNASDPNFNMHMCFYGNPGTGKTEVARIISRILHDAGVLEESKIVETDAHGLIGQYVGETAPKTLEKINEAMGGVLFIDEAYSLTQKVSNGATSYGDEAIAVLLKEMEDKRGRFCAILAGYKNEMREMISSNPGLESRIQFSLEFPDYSSEELAEIARLFAANKKYTLEDDALDLIVKIADYYRQRPNFANARTVRNILDQVIMNQNLRTEGEEENYTIIIDDVNDYLTDEHIDLNESDPGVRRIGFV